MKVKVRKIDSSDLVAFKNADSNQLLNAKRQIREPILKAIDVYKINVLYGAEKQTQLEKTKTLEYLQKLKDLDDSALENIPSKIKYYMS